VPPLLFPLSCVRHRRNSAALSCYSTGPKCAVNFKQPIENVHTTTQHAYFFFTARCIVTEKVFELKTLINEAAVRVLVVDDHEPFRRFVCSTLLDRQNLNVIGEASDGLEAVQRAEALQPDLILLDIGLPGMNGLDAARRIAKLAPNAKIIFLTQESSVEVVDEGLNLGARGFVTKLHAGRELLVAVEVVMQGQRYLSEGLWREWEF
jgi:CheY-like chemotaxis protein